MASELPTDDKERLLQSIGKASSLEDGLGPLATLVAQEKFSQIHLLSNYPKDVNALYVEWLEKKSGVKAKLHYVSFDDPTDYAVLLQNVRPILKSLKLGKTDQLCFHLSPGTPAMAAIWILLGKSLFPATLYQTQRGQYSVVDIPFDITVDVLPEVLREPDRFWQHLQVSSPQEIGGFEKIVGESPALRTAVGRAQRAAVHDVPILILGETGTGKEMFADAIHRSSSRGNRKLLSINCAAISKELIESELFGHVKGAFTGAAKDHTGLMEQANGGTLFLDEVGECDLQLQAKLLRALQPPDGKGPCYRVFRPVGSTEDRHADVRIIAATNRNLIRRVEEGEFREDLYHRLATITVKLPPLRERGDDIILLAEGLLAGINQQFSSQPGARYESKKLSVETKKFIRNQPWRGNVRELRNALIQAAVMSADDILEPEDIRAAIAEVPGQSGPSAHDVPLGGGFSIDDYLDNIQRRFLERALDESGGVKKAAAELLGFDNYQTLSNRMKSLGISDSSK